MDRDAKYEPDDLWPFSLEFTCVLALVILPFIGYALGYMSALETLR
jgi:hypothetical protein